MSNWTPTATKRSIGAGRRLASRRERPLRFEWLESRALLSISAIGVSFDPSVGTRISDDIERPATGSPAVANDAYTLYGLNFGPYTDNGEDPDYGSGQVTPDELWQRMTVVSPKTKWVRTFGCTGDLQDAGRLAHELGNSVAVGAWINSNLATNRKEIDSLVEQAVQGHADVVIVGSEVLWRGDVTEETLISYINEVKARLAAAGVSIPVTTADIYGSLMDHPAVIDAVDVVFANYYPFWERTSVDTAIAGLNRSHQGLTAMAGGKEVIVSETGWPSDGQQEGDAVPSPENAAFYFLNFVSWARAKNVKYFYFGAYDEPWKIKNEGLTGAHWGIFSDTQGTLKPGMDRVFQGETIPDPPIRDFFSLPDIIPTNIETFLVAGVMGKGHVVKLNGTPLPFTSVGTLGEFSYSVRLVAGQNTLELTVETSLGVEVESASKTVIFDPSFSTAGKRLLYVDAVPGGLGSPEVNGTVVIDLNEDAVLGLLPGVHVRGISPSGAEIYMQDRSVFSTSSHQQLRVLPFSQDIASNAFLVSPQGERLFSGVEVVDLASNILEPTPLPVNIATGNSWAGASIPGGPAITPDGRYIFARNSVVKVDTTNMSVVPTGITGTYTSDIAVSPDGNYLLVSRYYGMDIYDPNTFQSVGNVSTADFGGEIGFVNDGTTAVVGSSGNPQLLGGGVFLTDMNTRSRIDSFSSPLADNLETSSDYDEVFVSAGDDAWLAGPRLGVDVFVVNDGRRLRLTETFFLGINGFVRGYGAPADDQIRKLVYKSSPELTVGIVLDSGADPHDGVTNDQTLFFSGVAPIHSTVALTSNGELMGTARADGEGAWSIDHSGSPLPEGSYTIVARARDAAGNVIVGSEFHLRIDVTAPGAPLLMGISTDSGRSGSDGTTNDPTVTISGTAEANALVEVFQGGVSIGTVLASGSGVWSLDYTGTTLAEGIYSYTGKATDVAGNVSGASAALAVTVDMTAPGVPLLTDIGTDSGRSGSDRITNDSTLTISGTAEANGLVEVFKAGSSIGTTTANASGVWSFDYTWTTLAPGTYQFTARASDLAGNTSGTSAVFNVVVDTTGPTATVVAVAPDPRNTAVSTVDMVFSEPIDLTTFTAVGVSLTRDGSAVALSGLTTSLVSGNTYRISGLGSFTATDGTYVLAVDVTKVKDLAGNPGAGAASDTWVLDTTGPSATVVTVIPLSNLNTTEKGGKAEFLVMLNAQPTGSVTIPAVSLDTTEGTVASASLVFTPANWSQPQKVTVTGAADDLADGDVTYYVSLGPIASSDGKYNGLQPAVVTLVNRDDQGPLRVFISDTAIRERNSRSAKAVFQVSLSAASVIPVRVKYATADDTATAVGKDYVASRGTLTFKPGETSKTVTMSAKGDKRYEDDETFLVKLSSPTNAVIGQDTATCTVLNDDLPPRISIGDIKVKEGKSGTTQALFTVRLSAASGKATTVRYATTDGTATLADNDYQNAQGSVTIPARMTKVTIPVLVNRDTKHESNETFLVTISNPSNATIARGTGTGTIVNDDRPPTVSISDVTVTESPTATITAVFTVSLSAASGLSASVSYATADGNAKAGRDYASTNGTLVFAPGQLTQTVSVVILSDPSQQANETFYVKLSSPKQATLGKSKGKGTIQDQALKGLLATATVLQTPTRKTRSVGAAMDEAFRRLMLTGGL